MNTNFSLPQREEEPQVYKANQEKNARIQKAFKESLKEEIKLPERNIQPPEVSIPYILRFTDTYYGIKVGDIGYGYNWYANKPKIYEGVNMDKTVTTLKKQGYAIPCFHEGLMSRGINVSIRELTKEASLKDYYCPMKGTWHNLFDHYELDRAESWRDIVATLEEGHIVTVLAYDLFGDIKRRYINFRQIIQISGEPLLIITDDPEYGRVTVTLEGALNCVEVAWLW